MIQFDMESLLRQYTNAVILIKQKFDGKTDKGGKPYINHLFSVSNSIEKIVNDFMVIEASEEVISFYKKASITALLHDILEDTDTKPEDLVEIGFEDDIVKAVIAITRRHDEHSYFDYIERLKENDLAKLVKIYDLEDNMDVKRLSKLEEKDLKRIKKYWNCWMYLRGQITADECKSNMVFVNMAGKYKAKFKSGDYIKPIDSCLGSPRTICEVCDGWYVTNQGTLDFEFESNWEKV